MDGERRELEPRVLQVLVALACARPGVVSRERLISQCWNGRIVGDDALNRCIVALRHLANEFSPVPFAIETVPRVGYCLVELGANGAPVESVARFSRSARLAAAVIAFTLLATLLAYAWNASGRGEKQAASIAVLPFRNLTSSDAYFAEGVGEEILSQLAREPEFRVAGRISSSQFGKDPDLGEVARRLDVDYVLDGSVRTQDGRVRVTAALTRANDSRRLWSESYDGGLDNIFEIQQQIGSSVAVALRRKLVRTGPASRFLVTNGEAYSLYLTARGLIRTNKRDDGGTAARLLRDAISSDPDFAPAWAGLAEATRLEGASKGYEGFVDATPRAEKYARHALKLAPGLSDAHRTMGMILAFGAPDAQTHLRRAAELDPNNAENLIWLSVAHDAAGEFEKELATSRRAVDLDPYWFRTVASAAVATAEMGNRDEAEALVRRRFSQNHVVQHLLLSRIASIFGDYSEAVRRLSIVVRSNSPRWSESAKLYLNDANNAAGLAGHSMAAVPPPNDQRRFTAVWMDSAPSETVWRSRNRSKVAAETYREYNHKSAKLMLGAGRGGELISAYDGPAGLLTFLPGEPVRIDQLPEAPVVALALRQAGRAADEERLLRQANAAIRATYRRGRVPFWFDADCAAIAAVQGRNDDALSMLERAERRGWTHSANTDLRDIGHEPAFRSLRGVPRFESLRARMAARRAKERHEIGRLPL